MWCRSQRNCGVSRASRGWDAQAAGKLIRDVVLGKTIDREQTRDERGIVVRNAGGCVLLAKIASVLYDQRGRAGPTHSEDGWNAELKTLPPRDRQPRDEPREPWPEQRFLPRSAGETCGLAYRNERDEHVVVQTLNWMLLAVAQKVERPTDRDGAEDVHREEAQRGERVQPGRHARGLPLDEVDQISRELAQNWLVRGDGRRRVGLREDLALAEPLGAIAERSDTRAVGDARR